MRGMEITERLMHFNLTRQEATLYLLLLKAGRLTGYEAAKQTGISRSNTYTALAGLVEKGAAYIMEEAGSAGGVLQQQNTPPYGAARRTFKRAAGRAERSRRLHHHQGQCGNHQQAAKHGA